MKNRQVFKITSSLDSGDIVLFSGGSRRSQWIKRFSRSAWSHIGMVIRLRDHDAPLLWESTSLGALPDIQEGSVISGVQLVPLTERIQQYDGSVATRVLTKSLTNETKENLFEVIMSIKGRPYETCHFELFKAAYDGVGGRNSENDGSLFCSELIALTYQKIGLLHDKHPANEYTPGDFSEKSDIILTGNTLSPERLIKSMRTIGTHTT